MSVEADRERLLAKDPIAILIQAFLQDDGRGSLEVVCPEPGTTLDDGTHFLDVKGVNPDKMYSRIYTIALRMHYLKTELWVQKKGRSVWLHKFDYKAVKHE
ncbi:MAG: hypothetical protein JRC93_03950 [Deltaproteobacteria bacterium]|nr:hypothetical protein [Deltaproteobacteria bacterium]